MFFGKHHAHERTRTRLVQEYSQVDAAAEVLDHEDAAAEATLHESLAVTPPASVRPPFVQHVAPDGVLAGTELTRRLLLYVWG